VLAAITGDRQHRVDVNSRPSLIAIVYLAVVGPCVFILQPGFVQGLVEFIGLTEQQAGFIASAEMFGLATTTVLLSFVSSRVAWRNVVTICIFVCVLGNLASLGQSDFNTLAAIRYITGLGSGGIISLTFTMMGLTERSDRNFGYIVVWVLTYGAFGLLLMPKAYVIVGMNGVFVFFAAFCALGLAFVRHLPDSGDHVETTGESVHYSPALKGTTLAAILSYNIAIGIVWAYLFLVGLEAGMPVQAVANALTVSQFLGIAGAFLAVLFEVRLGRLLPLAIGIIGGAASVYYLVGDIGGAEYWIGVCGFNFLWNLSMPYLLATLADFDLKGRMVVHGVSMQFIGYAVGPAIAARLLGFGYDAINTTAAILFVAAALLLLPGVMAQREGLRR
jgi:predicted MFS family arabinose efflux permease